MSVPSGRRRSDHIAASGAAYYVALLIGATDTGAFSLVLEAHKLLANLAWAYLIGHPGLALIHHFTGDLPLAAMWSLRRRDADGLD